MAKARCTGWPKPVSRAYAKDETEREGGERKTADAESAADGEDECGEDAEVQAGDDEQMEGAGALEWCAQRAAEVGAVAGDHGGEHGGVVAAEGEPGGQRVWERAVRELHQAVAGGSLQGMLQASEAALASMLLDVELFCLGGADDADALAEHPGGTIPDAGIAVALGRLDRRCYGDDIAAAERRDDAIFGRVKREAQAALDGLKGFAGLRGGADVQIDGLHLLRDLLGGEGAEGDDAADGSRALDGADERDRLVLREMAKLGLRRGAWLHLCRKAAEKQPGCGERPERDARLPSARLPRRAGPPAASRCRARRA